MKRCSSQWNDEMFRLHPTPYTGLAGFVERMRIRVIRSFADIKLSDTVLEVGCEAGGLMAVLPECKRLVGVDISGMALIQAQGRLSSLKRNAEFVQCDATEALPFSKGEFSVIICSEMLEHVEDPAEVIANIVKISTPLTRIILSVPNEKIKIRLKRWLCKIGFMQAFMKKIEMGQSEWHVQVFSKPIFLELISKTLCLVKLDLVLGMHIIALCRPRTDI